MRRVLIVVLSTMLIGPALAVAQGPSKQQRRRVVNLAARGVFGDDVIVPNSWNTLAVEAQNNTSRTIRGTVRIGIRAYNSRDERYEVRLDLPPRSRRRVLAEVFIIEGGTVTVRYEEGERLLARQVVNVPYSPSTTSMVILSDPPRLRAALLDLDVSQVGVGPYASTRQVRMPVGTVSFDAATGDPVLPTRAIGWASVGVLVASAHDLARAGAAEQAALLDWLRTGGRLVVFTRTTNDFAEPFLLSLTGEVELYQGLETSGNTRLVPQRARRRYLRGSHEDFRTESFGGSRRHGFGRVYVAVYDGTSPSGVEAGETRTLIRSVLEATRSAGVDEPRLVWGRGTDDMGRPDWWGGQQTFGFLRTALDPNEGYRPALGLVAILLLIYIVVVGPVNFTFIGKKNRPTLALITTPAAAFGCLILMLGVGYIGKGTSMRYRSVEVVELPEGEPVGPARRMTGFFYTRPTEFDLEAPPRGMPRVIRAATADIDPVTDHGAEQSVVRDLRGRLWETVFVREERLVDVGGEVRFEREGRRLASVHNGTTRALRGAVIIDAGGSVYRIGDVPPGEQRPISQGVELTISSPGYYGGEDDPSMVSLARIMGLERERVRALTGTTALLGGLTSPPAPNLFAWSPSPDDREEVAGIFGREQDLTFVRVVPDLGSTGVSPAEERAAEELHPPPAGPRDVLEDFTP